MSQLPEMPKESKQPKKQIKLRMTKMQKTA